MSEKKGVRRERRDGKRGREEISMKDKEKGHCLEKGRGIDRWSLYGTFHFIKSHYIDSHHTQKQKYMTHTNHVPKWTHLLQ